ncbi:MAG: DNA mismatch repair endonuclease MutL [Pseudomonadota bacterium]
MSPGAERGKAAPMAFAAHMETALDEARAAGARGERPASAVKELLENALDAGARHVHVEIVGGGRRLIRISDDGQGILADEVSLALMRHATSKLRTAEDLQRIQTLGFRGEALSSIASVSQVALVTRHRDEELGTQIRVEGGTTAHQKPVGAPAGTVITVENLFYNTPARLKFLKSENTEKRHINNIVMHYAMAYPQVRFVLSQEGREVFRSPGSGQLADVVVKVFGLNAFREMLEVRGEERIRETGGQIGVYGFVSQPQLHRKDRTRITLFVNGRAVQDSGLTYAVTQAYHSLIDKGRHPYAVLMLDVPSYFVDVNVHPTKAEVRFQNTNVVFAALQRTVREAVVGYQQAVTHSRYGALQRSQEGWSSPYDRQMDFDFDSVDEAAQGNGVREANYDPAAIPDGPGRPDRPRTLPVLRVIGQVGAAYIVAEGPAGMYLIDQHLAHTRILYEELRALREQQARLPHRELGTQTIDLSPQDARLIEAHLEALLDLGFVLEPFGTQTYMIRAVPAVLTSGDPTDALWAMLDRLRESGATHLLASLAGRAAIKSGQILSTDDMQGLVRKLERCPNPLESPDGNATLIHMSAEHLAREFGRSR